ncbi:MAG TPA: DEDD exonuclease domain-containing protein [Acidimicrobiia bacterium]|jgi:DNA polymerase-3 subunit epsilon
MLTAEAGIQRSFDELGTPLFDVTFCVFDLETTGASAADCLITEIGAVKMRGGEVLATFQSLVDPGKEIPAFITVLTGITTAMVVEAPPIEKVLPTFLEFLGDAVVVGHNIRFDLSFLNAASRRLDYPTPANRSVDTVALARRLVRAEVRDLTLKTLANHFRSPTPPIHRALDDARATAHVFHGLLERVGNLGVTALEDLLQLPTARGAPHYRKLRLTDGLPSKPGVYLFRGRNREVLYVGKAANLRTRVRSYFYGDERRSINDLLTQLVEVDHRVCANALEAELVELRLIDAHLPRYNRRSKPPRTTYYIRLSREPFPRLVLGRGPGDGALLGPFRSKQQGEQVMSALWDALPLRRCKGKAGSRGGACAASQMGLALCPCDGSLDSDRYRTVVAALFDGIERRPTTLLDPLAERMQRLAVEQRYEEAAWARDRHLALATAIERRRAWQALTAGGRIVLEGVDGDRIVVESGRLVVALAPGEPTGLPLDSPISPSTPLPMTVGEAEEARLIWKWMTSGSVVVVACTGTLCLPVTPVPVLRAA